MPHFVIDCSESVLHLADPDALMGAVYAAADATGLFASSGVGGIKVRLRPYAHVLNVGGRPHVVHVYADVMEGRTAAQKRGLSEAVVGALKALLPEVEIISMNVRDFERATYCNAPMVGEGPAEGAAAG